MKIFVYAFANTSFFFNEVIKLSKKNGDDIEWGIVFPRGNYKNSADGYVKQENICYLYENFDETYERIDFRDFHYSTGIDNIYKILESSKFGFKREDSFTQLRTAYTIYTIYKEFLLRTKPDAFIFPDLEVVDGLILFNLCKELGIETMYCVHTRNLGKSFFAQDYYETLPTYFGSYTDGDLDTTRAFIDRYEQQKANMRTVVITESERVPFSVPNPFFRYAKHLYLKYRYESKHLEESSFILRLKMNLPKLVQQYRHFIFNTFMIRFFHITQKMDWVPENCILFPLQMTPESSINTLEQYFIEQERAIDLIRLNMPDNHYLLLKEHPSMIGKRTTYYYENLRKKPGCLLVSPYLKTDEFIAHSKMVVTITGTVSLESYLIDKPSFTFGPSFFSHLVTRFENYRDLKNVLQSLLIHPKIDKKEKKIEEIAKIYNVSYNFMLHEPFHFKQVMEVNNISNFLEAVKHHLKRLSEAKRIK